MGYNIKERAFDAEMVYNDLCALYEHFRGVLKADKKKWFSLSKLVKEFYLKGKLTAFVNEGAEILTLLKTTDNFQDTHELICGFNDALEHYRPFFIKAFILANMFKDEDPNDMFNVYTCGGEV